jgi:hypothetical protein
MYHFSSVLFHDRSKKKREDKCLRDRDSESVQISGATNSSPVYDLVTAVLVREGAILYQAKLNSLELTNCRKTR